VVASRDRGRCVIGWRGSRVRCPSGPLPRCQLVARDRSAADGTGRTWRRGSPGWCADDGGSHG
jgi:hypothetical protein